MSTAISRPAPPAIPPPTTRRQFVERELDAIEQLARDRKMPYIDYIASLRKQHGTDALVALLLKHCGPALRLGPDDLVKYVALEAQNHSELAVQRGFSNLIGYKYERSDIDAVATAIRRIIEAVEA
jgi:hypothetical protein